VLLTVPLHFSFLNFYVFAAPFFSRIYNPCGEISFFITVAKSKSAVELTKAEIHIKGTLFLKKSAWC
jgi:hypothetical protein